MIYRISGFGAKVAQLEELMHASKLADDKLVNGIMIVGNIVLVLLEEIMPLVLLVLTAVCTTTFIIVHRKNARNLDAKHEQDAEESRLRLALMERKLNDIDKTKS